MRGQAMQLVLPCGQMLKYLLKIRFSKNLKIVTWENRPVIQEREQVRVVIDRQIGWRCLKIFPLRILGNTRCRKAEGSKRKEVSSKQKDIFLLPTSYRILLAVFLRGCCNDKKGGSNWFLFGSGGNTLRKWVCCRACRTKGCFGFFEKRKRGGSRC